MMTCRNLICELDSADSLQVPVPCNEHGTEPFGSTIGWTFIGQRSDQELVNEDFMTPKHKILKVFDLFS